ncbi:MAG: SH3 domain-containing protein [Haloechinothrix sp.]
MILGFPKRTVIIAAALVGFAFFFLLGGKEWFSQGFASGPCRFTVSADSLNVRAAPSAKAPIVDKIKSAEEINAYPVVKNGFRMLAETKWAADEFLEQRAGSVCA